MGRFLSGIKQNLCSNSLVWIKPIEDETDLWYAVEECKITSRQMEYVNPASFSVGRAYLDPENSHFTKTEIMEKIEFTEKYYNSEIIMMDDKTSS